MKGKMGNMESWTPGFHGLGTVINSIVVVYIPIDYQFSRIPYCIKVG